MNWGWGGVRARSVSDGLEVSDAFGEADGLWLLRRPVVVGFLVWTRRGWSWVLGLVMRGTKVVIGRSSVS